MYYPPSQIKTNLYTNGNELVYSSDYSDYQGYYYKTSNGKYYTGRNPDDGPVSEIIIPNYSKEEDAEEGEEGNYTSEAALYLVPDVYAQSQNLNTNSIPPKPPTQITRVPTEENYQLGEYQRYFSTKLNEVQYKEISLNEYNKFKNEEPDVDYFLYNVFTLPWLISGDRNEVVNVNKLTTERIQRRYSLVGFTSYFDGKYDQYFKYTPGENLTTDGTEFIVERTGRIYSGLYHVHPNKGPMVGAQHVPYSHDYLIPISGSNIDYKINKAETQNTRRIVGSSNRMGGSY